MTFAERIAEQAAAERSEGTERVRRQAAARATFNGIDAAIAADEAERLWHPGASHEAIVSEVAGEFRRTA